ncbi:unnamed protein product [Cuscuta campestris]|uniref:DUF4283 domain-containing protein n=1 Tax=Cuscuta campestris TaxID=132261 RepID=A0A484L9J6_9ASTE|nr:unnamed protein product [Cuscuta campestris]
MTARKRGRPRKKKSKTTYKLQSGLETPCTGESTAGKNATPMSDSVLVPNTLDVCKSRSILLCNEEEKLNSEMKKQKPEEAQVKTYAEIVGKTEILESELKYVQTEELNGTKIARLTKEDVIEMDNYWNAAAVCCVLGANPPLKVMDGFIRRIWKDFKITEIAILREGQFVVNFEQKEDRDEIVKRKYYFMDNKPVLVQKYNPGMKIRLEELTDIPI